MLLSEIQKILEAEVLACADKLDQNVKTACASDLMSDVLAFSKEKVVLLTGLVNPQVIRTAEMLDIKAVIFVRGKTPTPEIVELAEEKGVVVFTTKNLLYISSGLLYKNGLGGDDD